MLIFIDESGDPGFRLDKQSSDIFVVCLIIFDDELEAEKVAVKIKELRRKLKKPDCFEFKFNKCSKEYRIKFLETVKDAKFKIRATVVLKKDMTKLKIKKNKLFYPFVIKKSLEENLKNLSNVKLRLDGKGERLFRREFLTYLRKNLKQRNQKIIKDLRFRDSRGDVLIQLADMVAGAINRGFQKDKTDAKIYWNIIKKKKEKMIVLDE